MPPVNSTATRSRVPTVVVRFVVNGLAKLGVETGEVVERCGIGPWAEYGRRVPRQLLFDVWEAAVQISGQAALGIRLAERTGAPQWAGLGGLARTSATVGEALLQMSRATRLMTDSLRVSYSVEGDRCSWILDPVAQDRYHREHVEFFVASGLLTIRRLSRTQTKPLEVFFRHKAPADTTHHDRLFGAPLRYGSAKNSFEFDSSVLSKPVKTHDPDAHARLTGEVDRLLAEQGDPGDIRRQVRDTIEAELEDGQLSSDRVASRLGMHSKTLARRLREVGTTYRQLLEDLRYEQAIEHLRDRSLSLEEVALRLGYSESSSFHRAFTRWSGLSPDQFRRKVIRKE